MNPRNILIKYWGYSSFRPLQEEIIESVLAGKDTLALLPTGGGKSVCFQVPGLAMEGLCLVVTPLIALMNDQVMHLKKKGIKAVAIHSGMNRREIEVALDNCMFGDIKFLYLSPERLQTEQFIQTVQRMKVNLVAVDEAHCISQWGYDFRPPYLKIQEIRAYLKGIPVLALTATATPKVVEDIQQKLGFPKENIFRKSFERKNLSYIVIRDENKLGRLLRIFSKVAGPAIIYVRNRKKTAEVAKYLKNNKVSADYYHAGLDATTREKKQNSWMRESVRVMVSTNAFGMGIDKPNVRLVIHLDLPDSPEAYFQEAGRAGRDEKRAYAIVVYDEADLHKLQEGFDKQFPQVDSIKNIYQSLGNYFQLPVGAGREECFEFDLTDFAKNYSYNPVMIYNSLKFLEREGYLVLSEAIEQPSRIHIEVDREELYRFQVENKSQDAFIKLLLRSYSGVFSGFQVIREEELARRANIETSQVIKKLEALQNHGIMTYVKKSGKPEIMYATERLEQKNLRISPKVYHDRKSESSLRMQAMIDYVSTTSFCRSQFLIRYFGEDDIARCGTCDVCRQRNKMDLNEMEFDNLRAHIKKLLQEKPMTLPEIVWESSRYSEEQLLQVLRWLEDKGIIRKDNQRKYTWQSQFRMRL
jgi:ATP-dependent DNA helicase RecQ